MKAVEMARSKDILALECSSKRSERNIHWRVHTLECATRTQICAIKQAISQLQNDIHAVTMACTMGNEIDTIGGGSSGISTVNDLGPASSYLKKVEEAAIEKESND